MHLKKHIPPTVLKTILQVADADRWWRGATKIDLLGLTLKFTSTNFLCKTSY